MKFYLPTNVFDAAVARIDRIYSEFENVMVNISGGKDSTVILHLALLVAERRRRLPVPVLFIDQECEWQSVIDLIRQTMKDPRIQPIWLQCPFKIENGSSPLHPWGLKQDKNHYAFSPIYDWAIKDVWKAIHSNAWPYCTHYDALYRYGVPLNEMRVSNLNHETAIRNLFILQEIEPDTWNRVTARLEGVNTAGQLGSDGYLLKNIELPSMFPNWWEYRDYLLEHLIPVATDRAKLKKQFERVDRHFHEGKLKATEEIVCRGEIAAILVNDYTGTKISNFMSAHRYIKSNPSFIADQKKRQENHDRRKSEIA